MDEHQQAIAEGNKKVKVENGYENENETRVRKYVGNSKED